MTRHRTLALLAPLVLLTAWPVDGDSRPPRPPRPVEHTRFTPEHVARRLAPFAERYDRITLVSTLRTAVERGDAACRLTWTGHRVDLSLDPSRAESLDVRIPMPADAELGSFDVYRIAANGRDGETLDDDHYRLSTSDTLLVLTAPVDETRPAVEVRYTIEGKSFIVDDIFVFRQPWPTLDAEYRFAVKRDLWHDATQQGLSWQFEALAHPRTWRPRRDDTADFFTWYWREQDIEPGTFGTPDSLTVSGLLPAPFLARFDPDEVEEIRKLEPIRSIRDELIFEYAAHVTGSRFDQLRQRYADSDPDDFDELVPVGPDK